MTDTSHVPPPDPDKFWPFAIGQERMIGLEPYLSFRLDAIHETFIEGTETLGEQVVQGRLFIDRPVVISKWTSGEPEVTLTLRRIEDGTAFLQVTANPKLKVGWRQ